MYTDPTGYLKLGGIFKAAVVAVAAYYTAGAVSGWLAASGSSWAIGTGVMATEFGMASYTTLSIAGGAVAGAAGGFVAGVLGGGSFEAGMKGAVSGALF